jgi:DUF1365 family protein
LSVHWCLTASGRPRFAVLEIHNTYGQRHAHLVHLDQRDRAEVAKEFYVSPFFAVSGRYRVRLQLGPHRVLVSIVLDDDQGRPLFAAAFRGTPRPATWSTRLAVALRTPLVAHQTSARIRWHGIRLWARLPVQPRPAHRPPWAGTDDPDQTAPLLDAGPAAHPVTRPRRPTGGTG